MKQTSISIAMCLGFVAAGCGSGGGAGTPQPVAKTPAPVKISPGEESKLLPLKVGNEWNYAVELTQFQGGRTVQQSSIEASYTVKSLTNTATGTRAVIEVKQKLPTETKILDNWTWEVRKDGIFQIGQGKGRFLEYSSPQPIVPFPPTNARVVNWKGTIPQPKGNSVQYTSKFTVHGAQPVDTEMGEFSAISVESGSTVRESAKSTWLEGTKIWVSPNVGIVRMLLEKGANNTVLRQVWKLKSHNVK